MLINLNKLFVFFIGMSIVLLPFNGLALQGIFGELGVEGAFYPLCIGICIWLSYLLQKQKIIKLPKTISFYLFISFYLWILISGGINLPTILAAYTKGRSGIEKLFLQFLVMGFVFVSTLFIYNFIGKIKQSSAFFRRMIFISFCIAGIYSIIEIAFLFDNEIAGNILNAINMLFRSETGENSLYFGRLRSVSGEASHFAIYLSLITPWIASYIFTSKDKFIYSIINVYLSILVILTMSRTAYFIYSIQIFMLGFYFNREILLKYKKKVILLAVVFLSCIVALSSLYGDKYGMDVLLSIFTSLGNDEAPQNLSNIARFGSQVAALNIFDAYPIWGTGLGQYGFYMSDYAPSWSYVSPEILIWIDASNPIWPPVHNLYARILAELGILGLILWLSFWGCLVYELNCLQKKQKDDAIFIKIVMISIAGVLLSGFAIDSFRFFGYWLLVGISWRMIINEDT